MPVFSRILGKVSRWELPSSHFSRRELSSPSLSSETNHKLACDSGQDRSASRSLKDAAAPYGLFDQETEQSDFATQLSKGKLGATRALKQSSSNCNSSYLPSGAANVLAPASSSPGATLSCLNVGNHNEQLGSYCKSTYVSAPSGPTNVLAPASPSPGATLSCLNVGNHNEQSGSLCKSTYVSAPSGPAFTLAASSTTGATLSCLNVGVLNERLGSNRESDWILAQRGQRAPSPKTWAAENGNDPISSQSSTNKTARATLNTMSGSSASPTKNLDNKGATNYTNMSGKSASSAVKSSFGSPAASSTAKSVLTVIGGTAASSSPSQSHDSSSSVSVTVNTAQRLQRKLCPNLSENVTHDAVESCLGGTAASPTPSQSHDSNSSVSITVDTAQRLQRELCPNLSENVTHDAEKSCLGGNASSTTSSAVNNVESSMGSPAASSTTGTTTFNLLPVNSAQRFQRELCPNLSKNVAHDATSESNVLTESAFFDHEPDHDIGDIINEVLSSDPLETSSNSLYIPCNCRECKCEMTYCSCLPCPNAWFNWRLAEKLIPIPMLFNRSAMNGMLYGVRLTESVALQIFDIPMTIDWKWELLQCCNEFRITLLCEQSGKVLFSPGISGGGRPKGRGRRGPLVGRIPKGKKKVAVAAKAEESDPVASCIDGEEIIPDTNNGNNPSSSVRTEVQGESNLEVSSNSESEAESQSKQAKYDAKYRDSTKGKASLKRYRSKPKGIAAQKKAYAAYLSGVKEKLPENKLHQGILRKRQEKLPK